MIPHAECLQWVQWWASGWLRADQSWRIDEYFSPRERALVESASQLHHAAFAQRLGLPQGLPSAPDPVVLRLSEWSDARSRALLLIAEICGKDRVADLHEAEILWCRRVARALLPGQWLPPEWVKGDPAVDGLRLLRCRLDEACWRRARLLFAKPMVEQVESCTPQALPAGKLATLWDAVVWKNQQLWQMGERAC
jgi:hypothetical protein